MRPRTDIAQRGDQIYEREVLPRLRREDDGKFVAIDVTTGEYEIANEELEACDLLNARLPEAEIWLCKVGSPFVYRFGHRFVAS